MSISSYTEAVLTKKITLESLSTPEEKQIVSNILKAINSQGGTENFTMSAKVGWILRNYSIP